MNSNFEVFIQYEDGTYAGRAARAAFCEVDRLEGILSRFIENSDIANKEKIMQQVSTTHGDSPTAHGNIKKGVQKKKPLKPTADFVNTVKNT